MVKNIIPKLGMSFLAILLWQECHSSVRKYLSLQSYPSLFLLFLLVSPHVMSPVFLLSSVSGRASYQPSPAADGAISLGDGLGGYVVPLQPRVPAGQKLLFKVVAGQ